MTYFVEFKCDACDGVGGYGGTHSRDFGSRAEADAYAAHLHEAGDCYDIEIIEEITEDD